MGEYTLPNLASERLQETLKFSKNRLEEKRLHGSIMNALIELTSLHCSPTNILRTAYASYSSKEMTLMCTSCIHTGLLNAFQVAQPCAHGPEIMVRIQIMESFVSLGVFFGFEEMFTANSLSKDTYHDEFDGLPSRVFTQRSVSEKSSSFRAVPIRMRP